MIIRMKIVGTTERGVWVNFYTDALLEQAQTEGWPERVRQIMAQFPPEAQPTPEAALTEAQQKWPAGEVCFIEFAEDPVPTGEELRMAILRQAPWHPLEMADKAASGALVAVDFVSRGIAAGVELQGTLDELKAVNGVTLTGSPIKVGTIP